ncbi:MAG: hypothetical protein ISQ32_01530 [Rickettsiales bacterium]|nr:hypothetical protein [Rickettsiales bacterium]
MKTNIILDKVRSQTHVKKVANNNNRLSFDFERKIFIEDFIGSSSSIEYVHSFLADSED